MDRRAFDLSRELLALTKQFDDAAAKAALAAKQKVRKTGRSRARWPMVSDRAGCMPNQVEEANENCRKMGLAARYDPEGYVHYPSAKARREHLKSIGMYDRSGYD